MKEAIQRLQNPHLPIPAMLHCLSTLICFGMSIMLPSFTAGNITYFSRGLKQMEVEVGWWCVCLLFMWLWLKNTYQNGTLGNGTKDYIPRNPGSSILSHTHVSYVHTLECLESKEFYMGHCYGPLFLWFAG